MTFTSRNLAVLYLQGRRRETQNLSESNMPSVNASILNPSQVFILKALAASPGLTREALEAKVGPAVAVTADNLGPAYKETLESNPKYGGSLWGLGLVRPIYDEVDGEMVPVWHATAAGRKLASTIHTRERSRPADKIPPEIIDPVLRKFRTTRTYQFELYTDQDIREIKELLGKYAEDLSLEAIRVQMANRRKQGAFADPDAKIKKAIERTIREFGPEGTIASILTEEQVDTLLALKEAGK